jgi:hypothetical protein
MDDDQFYAMTFNMALVVGHAEYRLENCGMTMENPSLVPSVLRASIITWHIACEEARAQRSTGNANANFVESCIEPLPENDDPTWPRLLEPPATSPLKRRLEALWGIRIAFTHSVGDTKRITSAKNRQFAVDSPMHIPGVKIVREVLDLSALNLHYVSRSFDLLRAIS